MIVFEIGSLVVSITVFEIGSLVVSISALISAAVAIWLTHKQSKANIKFSEKQSKAIIKYNKLSIKPMIDTHIDTYTNTAETIMSLTLQNNGLGTAVIKKITLLLDGKKIKNEDPMNFIVEKIKADCSVKSNNITVFSLGERGRGLLSGGSIILIKMKFQGELSEEDKKEIDRFDIKINYESLDGKKYIHPPKEKT